MERVPWSAEVLGAQLLVVLGVVGAGVDEVGDLFERADASACSYGGAVESSGCAGEFELAIQRPVLQECIDEASVEDVAGAGGVDYWDAKG